MDMEGVFKVDVAVMMLFLFQGMNIGSLESVVVDMPTLLARQVLYVFVERVETAVDVPQIRGVGLMSAQLRERTHRILF